MQLPPTLPDKSEVRYSTSGLEGTTESALANVSPSPQTPWTSSPQVDKSALRRHDAVFTLVKKTGNEPREMRTSLNRPRWLSEALDGWHNPTFPTRGPQPGVAGEAASADQKSIEKGDLTSLEFISQVDSKFLLCRLRESIDGATCLLLLDQHAADERVRIETIFRDYLSDVAHGLVEFYTPPQPILLVLASREISWLLPRMKELAQWGILVRPQDNGMHDEDKDRSGEAFGQVEVISVPAILADRLGTDARLLQQLLRSFSASEVIPHGHPADGQPSEPFQEQAWRSLRRRCPRVITELLISKACRGGWIGPVRESTESSTFRT